MHKITTNSKYFVSMLDEFQRDIFGPPLSDLGKKIDIHCVRQKIKFMPEDADRAACMFMVESDTDFKATVKAVKLMILRNLLFKVPEQPVTICFDYNTIGIVQLAL